MSTLQTGWMGTGLSGDLWEPDTVLVHDILATLEVSPHRSTPCPALQELVISTYKNVSDEALLRFIVPRMPTLRLVDITFHQEIEVDIPPSCNGNIRS
ncbi:hypothetical protein B0H12DRAFT_1242519 [Mycena haematopus]|nr:hypothetical protein B0H12DRAFT_1242519 [Mycena haematopus]